MITPQNITAHEWIGLKVKIAKSTDPTIQGLEGIVRDETMNTFTIEANGKLRQIQKQKTTFEAELTTENVEVETVVGDVPVVVEDKEEEETGDSEKA